MTKDIQHECEQLIDRAGRAYRYMMGTLNGMDIYYMHNEIENLREVYPCITLSSEEVVEEFLERYYEFPSGADAICEGDLPRELLYKLHGYANTAAYETAYNFDYYHYSELRASATDRMEQHMKDDDYEPPGELGIQAMLAAEKTNVG